MEAILKIEIFLNRYIEFVEGHTRQMHAKFQVSSMYGDQINVLIVCFKKLRLEFHTNPNYQKLIARATNNIFNAVFCI